MPNLVNRAITTEYENAFEGGVDALVVQPVGLTVAEVNAFRAKLSESQLRMRLVKGSLAKRILEANGLQSVEEFFDGPAAFITADGDEVELAAVAASRVVTAWRKATGNPLPAVKGGLMDGGVLGSEAALGLAKLPTKAELQSRIVAQILGPASKLSSQLVAGGAKIAGAVKSHIEKLEQQG
jgi:large subunit ribosomal protein L10